jgi:hypothetical protein
MPENSSMPIFVAAIARGSMVLIASLDRCEITPDTCALGYATCPARGRTVHQLTVSVKVVEASMPEFELSVPVTVMVYVPALVVEPVTMTVAVPVAAL